LVEKALKKMLSAQAAVSERANAPAARVPETAAEAGIVATALPPGVSPLPLPGHRNDKIVTVNPTLLRSRGLLPQVEHERRLTAEYRQIKRPLMAGAKGRGPSAVPNGRVIMIASALPAEGKTFTSVNLALSMALEKDTSVLLVDGDLAKSEVTRAFELQGEPGLMDLLSDGSMDSASVVLPTTVRGLSILPAGRDSTTATEHLASSRMESVVAELLGRDPARIVLFDSPPLLLTTESRALTAVVGQVLVVVRAEETTHKAVLDALACISEGRSVGLVLNQCAASAEQFYYGYGEYAEYGQPAAADAERQ
jgi:exopolysaccharide/PEP-CTERM locus tyrosine autokinase